LESDLIYLDNNASTAPDPAVLDAVTNCLRELYANPASQHAFGLRAAQAVERAREQVAELISCSPREVTFTSGATEADGLAIRGVWEASRLAGSQRDTIVVGATEHPAVLESARSLARVGAQVVVVPVDSQGIIELGALREATTEGALLVSVMAANNETGTLSPLDQVVQIAHSAGAYVHSDATQMIGRMPFDTRQLDLDLVSLSSHKMHGVKGAGALICRRTIPIAPQIHGGGHERGLRSGTLDTPAIVGLGKASEIAGCRIGEADEVARLRNNLQDGLMIALDGVTLNGDPCKRLPNTVNLRFAGADAEAIMASLVKVACSTGSACSSGVPAASHVLLAMGLDSEAAGQCLRFSLSRNTTSGEIDAAIAELVRAVEYVRAASRVPQG